MISPHRVLLGHLLTPGWTALIVAGAAIALINDLPAMLLVVSRLMFAWAEDGIFPQAIAKVHPGYKTPQKALIASGVMASIGILGSHFAGDFFLGIDIMVTSMLVNFLLICVSLITIRKRNPDLQAQIRAVKSRIWQLVLGWGINHSRLFDYPYLERFIIPNGCVVFPLHPYLADCNGSGISNILSRIKSTKEIRGEYN